MNEVSGKDTERFVCLYMGLKRSVTECVCRMSLNNVLAKNCLGFNSVKSHLIVPCPLPASIQSIF